MEICLIETKMNRTSIHNFIHTMKLLFKLYIVRTYDVTDKTYEELT